jgi:copper chaperone
MRAVLNVPGVSCAHCKMAIEGAVGALAGVSRVEVDVDAKSVTVEYDEGAVALDAIEAAVGEEGYEVAGRHLFGG